MCIFCEIVKGNIPCFEVYSDDKFLAFLDIADDYEGHTLVIPKVHYKNICEIPERELSELTALVQKISKHYMSLGYDGINICNNTGACAGQSVEHIHFHILPRKNDDGKICWNTYPKLNSDMSALQEKLKLK